MTTATTATKPIPRLPGGVPLLGNALEFQKNRFDMIRRLARECGDIGSFQVGPKNILVLNSAELMQELLVDKMDQIHRGPFFDTFIPIMGEHSLLTTDGPYHRKQRKMHIPAFGHRRMPQYASTMMESIVSVVDGLKDGQQVDMDDVMGKLTRLIIAKTLFGLDEGPASTHFQHCIALIEKHLTKMTSTMLPIPLWVPTPSNRAAMDVIATLRNRADEIIREHEARSQGQDTGDLLSILRETRNEDDGTKLSLEQLRDHVVSMYIAGQETTAVALVWMCIHISQNPDVQRKLQEEVDTQLQGRPPTFEDLARLPYSLKVVKETLRLTPPASLFGRETLEEIRLGDYIVPPKQFILLCTWTMQRMAKYYPDPDRFDPERFQPELEKSRPRAALLPFGTGVHTCIGNHFAMVEMQLILAYLVQRMSIELRPGQDIQPKLFVTVKPSSSDFIVRTRPVQQPRTALG